METPHSQTLAPVHTVPTHLTTVDTVLSLGTFSLSSRQLLLLLCGGSVCATLWTHTAMLVRWLPPLGAILHAAVVILLVIGVLALTFGQVQGRSLESWLLVIALYLGRPRLSLWRRRLAHPVWPQLAERDDAAGTTRKEQRNSSYEQQYQGETQNWQHHAIRSGACHC
jgi:hypothetical protein